MRCGDFKENYIKDEEIFQSRFVKFWLALFFIFLIVFPFIANAHMLYIANMIGFAVIGAIGLNLLTGFHWTDFPRSRCLRRCRGLYLSHPDYPLWDFFLVVHSFGRSCLRTGWFGDRHPFFASQRSLSLYRHPGCSVYLWIHLCALGIDDKRHHRNPYSTASDRGFSIQY